MKPRAIEIREVTVTTEAALAIFFAVLRARGAEVYFHPHPLTDEAAHERAHYAGRDYYCVLIEGGEILGYGMLRGWDEGFEIPSLGIAIHPDAHRQGLGRLLMDFLRMAALRRGAKRIRLRVRDDNIAAVRLYLALGYQLAPEAAGGYLAGFLELGCG